MAIYTTGNKVKVRLPSGDIEAWEVTPENLSYMDVADPLNKKAKWREVLGDIPPVDEDEIVFATEDLYKPQFVLGGDVSRWQGRMNWGTFWAGGGRFVIIRASFAGSDGGIFEDIEFAYNKEEVKKILEAVGYYHFFRGDIDPIAQANFFADLIQDAYMSIPPMIDVETADGVQPSTLANRILIFINHLKRRLGIDRVLIYTRASFWNWYVEYRPEWGLEDLDIARYDSSLDHPWGDGNYKPRDWNTWQFWQWTSIGSGVIFGASSTYIDLQYFNGDYASLKNYISIDGNGNGEEERMIIRYAETAPVVDGDATIIYTIPQEMIIEMIGAVCTSPGDSFVLNFVDSDGRTCPLAQEYDFVRLCRIGCAGDITALTGEKIVLKVRKAYLPNAEIRLNILGVA